MSSRAALSSTRSATSRFRRRFSSSTGLIHLPAIDSLLADPLRGTALRAHARLLLIQERDDPHFPPPGRCWKGFGYPASKLGLEPGIRLGRLAPGRRLKLLTVVDTYTLYLRFAFTPRSSPFHSLPSLGRTTDSRICRYGRLTDYPPVAATDTLPLISSSLWYTGA